MHIYIFGSLCRGEVSIGSDIDALALTEAFNPNLDAETFSIYSYRRIGELWAEGNPFAWHLSREARLVYASDGVDFLKNLGVPAPYRRCREDCQKFVRLFDSAIYALSQPNCSLAFELSLVFLAIRNFATCYCLGVRDEKNFSRHSARCMGEDSVPLSESSYLLIERARIVSTRGIGRMISPDELSACITEIRGVRDWMGRLLTQVPNHG